MTMYRSKLEDMIAVREQRLPLEEFRRLSGLDHVGNIMEDSSPAGAIPIQSNHNGVSDVEKPRRATKSRAYTGGGLKRESVDRFLEDHVEEGSRGLQRLTRVHSAKIKKHGSGSKEELAVAEKGNQKIQQHIARADASRERNKAAGTYREDHQDGRNPLTEGFRDLAGLVKPDKPLKKVTRGTGGISLDEFKNLCGITSRQPPMEETRGPESRFGGLGDIPAPRLEGGGLAGFAHEHLGGMDAFLEMAGVTKKS